MWIEFSKKILEKRKNIFRFLRNTYVYVADQRWGIVYSGLDDFTTRKNHKIIYIAI